jgi:Amt family ammonium transporter
VVRGGLHAFLRIGLALIGSFDMNLNLPFLPKGDRIPVHALAPHIPAPAFALFEGAFAIITAALIVGAFARAGEVRCGCLVLRAVVCAGLRTGRALGVAPEGGCTHWACGLSRWHGGARQRGRGGLACALVAGPTACYGREPMIPSNWRTC